MLIWKCQNSWLAKKIPIILENESWSGIVLSMGTVRARSDEDASQESGTASIRYSK